MLSVAPHHGRLGKMEIEFRTFVTTTRGRFVVSFIPNPLDWRLVGLSHSRRGGENKVISEILFVCNFGVLPEEQEEYPGYTEPRGTGYF
jgi:hypothetical protein